MYVTKYKNKDLNNEAFFPLRNFFLLFLYLNPVGIYNAELKNLRVHEIAAVGGQRASASPCFLQEVDWGNWEGKPLHSLLASLFLPMKWSRLLRWDAEGTFSFHRHDLQFQFVQHATAGGAAETWGQRGKDQGKDTERWRGKERGLSMLTALRCAALFLLGVFLVFNCRLHVVCWQLRIINNLELSVDPSF